MERTFQIDITSLFWQEDVPSVFQPNWKQKGKTIDQGDEKTLPDQKKDNDEEKDKDNDKYNDKYI